ncbi:hypothetical protein ACE41H_18620 [Paenibacillus enshidis]|uniref:Uncharacterized protein n=1 Tax=Paenibacillus enshidis TaxID=1458439 RepID=A0ABV5B099_9BACL
MLLEILLYWLLLLAAAACVVAVSGRKRVASLIVLAPIVLFCTLLLMQTLSYKGQDANIGLGLTVFLIWAITALLFILAAVMWLLKRRNRSS